MMAGQREMAIRVQDAGVGLSVNKSTFTPEELRRAVLRVLQDDSFRRPIPALQSLFKLAGGWSCRRFDRTLCGVRRFVPDPRLLM